MTPKFKSISLLSLITAAALFYTACKKSETVIGTNGPDKSAISVQIAQNLFKSLTGAYGTVNVNKKMSTSSTGLKVNTTQCGTYIDSAVNYTTNVGDTIKSKVTGHFNYKYICDSSNWNTIGYTLKDSTHTTGTAPGYDFLYVVKQNYDAITKNFDYGHVTVNGTQTSHITITSKSAKVKSSHQDNDFLLKDVVVYAYPDQDIVSGRATFVAHGNLEGVAYDFSGYVDYLSNHKAYVAFSGEAFIVDLLTGAVSPSPWK